MQRFPPPLHHSLSVGDEKMMGNGGPGTDKGRRGETMLYIRPTVDSYTEIKQDHDGQMSCEVFCTEAGPDNGFRANMFVLRFKGRTQAKDFAGQILNAVAAEEAVDKRAALEAFNGPGMFTPDEMVSMVYEGADLDEWPGGDR